ncbi:MAG: flavodoxin family protein [Anaerofustis stercorihominis]|nr:flavodoxin family protein [Anaerofustis stercorihominis]
MNILAITSSPRPYSNSRTLLREIERGIKDKGEHNLVSLDVAKMNIAPCRACEACRGKAGSECVIKDDMIKVAEEFRKADYIFMATPIYWWDVCAQLKLVIDRLYCIDNSEWPGKTFHLVITGQTETSNVGYYVIKNAFAGMCEWLKVDLKAFCVSAYDETHIVTENKQALADAYELGLSL